ncbi:MAG: hypothetical protein WA160_17055 [Pseudobdellovibrio sp.]
MNKSNFLNISMKIFVGNIVLLASIFTISVTLKAEENSDYVEKARERRYVGGVDESDLKVQKAVTATKTKVKTEDNQESNEGF